MRVTNEAEKIFKKIWRSEKKVIPLHPQKRATSSLRNIDNTAQKDLD